MSREKFNHSENLKKVRETLGLSQQELAERLSVKIYKIKDTETGKIQMSLDLALLLEEKFNFNFRWLLTGQGPMIGKAGGAAVFEPSTTVDAKKLEGIIERIEDGLATNQLPLEPKKKARLISLLYEHSMEAGKEVNRATVQKYLDLIG